MAAILFQCSRPEPTAKSSGPRQRRPKTRFVSEKKCNPRISNEEILNFTLYSDGNGIHNAGKSANNRQWRSSLGARLHFTWSGQPGHCRVILPPAYRGARPTPQARRCALQRRRQLTPIQPSPNPTGNSYQSFIFKFNEDIETSTRRKRGQNRAAAPLI